MATKVKGYSKEAQNMGKEAPAKKAAVETKKTKTPKGPKLVPVPETVGHPIVYVERKKIKVDFKENLRDLSKGKLEEQVRLRSLPNSLAASGQMDPVWAVELADGNYHLFNGYSRIMSYDLLMAGTVLDADGSPLKFKNPAGSNKPLIAVQVFPKMGEAEEVLLQIAGSNVQEWSVAATAKAIKKLEGSAVSRSEIAKAMGLSESQISNYLKVLDDPKLAKTVLNDGKITFLSALNIMRVSEKSMAAKANADAKANAEEGTAVVDITRRKDLPKAEKQEVNAAIVERATEKFEAETGTVASEENQVPMETVDRAAREVLAERGMEVSTSIVKPPKTKAAKEAKPDLSSVIETLRQLIELLKANPPKGWKTPSEELTDADSPYLSCMESVLTGVVNGDDALTISERIHQSDTFLTENLESEGIGV